MQKIVPGIARGLHNVAATRYIEQHALAALPAHALMQRAGLTVAQLALALAPHAQRIWLACGPGNNGGDGLAAATHLQRWGKNVVVSWLGQIGKLPADSLAAQQRLLAGGIAITGEPTGHFDLVVDALLGIGMAQREPSGVLAQWIRYCNALDTRVLAVDVPSGLNADTGSVTPLHIKASHTLSLLTLKPGLFTAQGPDASGQVWFDDLQLGAGADKAASNCRASAELLGKPNPSARPHDSHKGSFGDVAVIGGAPTMTGAALLAASAALHSGAGRVYVTLLNARFEGVNLHQPELMFRTIEDLDYAAMVVVCGCGAGRAIEPYLSAILAAKSPLVLDADALNCIAEQRAFQHLLRARAAQQLTSILTPHPLEAARLLACSRANVQADRLAAATHLSQTYGCTVVLKGAGSVIAAPTHLPAINPTGNARLASAGTGDVLAGMIGAYLAAGQAPFEAACQAVYQHGQVADQWPAGQSLTASQVALQGPAHTTP